MLKNALRGYSRKFMVWTGLLRHGTDEKNNSDVKYAIPFNCLEPKAWDHGN